MSSLLASEMDGLTVNVKHQGSTASTFKEAVSGRDRWADVFASDGEDDEEQSFPESPRSATSSTLLAVEEARTCPWNLAATEFIPTLSMTCPVVNTIVYEDEALIADSNAVAVSSRAAAILNATEVLVPRLDRALTEPSACSNSSFGSRRSVPAATTGTHRGKRITARRLLSSPALLSFPARSTTSETASRPARAVVEAEELTEEQLARRIEQREKDISLAKGTLEYQWYTTVKREGDEPLTPDPRDHSISKRHWKYCVSVWRNSVMQRYHEHLSENRSVISVEDCQSTCETTTSAGSTRASGREIEDHEEDSPCARQSDDHILGAC